MFRHLIIFILVLFSFAAGYLFATAQLSQPKQLIFENKLQSHYVRLARNIDTQSIIFLGSSSIQGMDVSKVTKNAINLGIGGENIQRLTLRLSQYPSLSNAKAIVIAAGFNDVCRKPLEEIKRDFEKLISIVIDKPKVISSLQPSANRNVCNDISSRINAFNAFVMSLCQSDELCRYVDIESIFKHSYLKTFESDGIHLNNNGYRIWSEEIGTQLRKVLSMRREVKT